MLPKTARFVLEPYKNNIKKKQTRKRSRVSIEKETSEKEKRNKKIEWYHIKTPEEER